MLYVKGFEPESHQGVISLFGQKVVMDGEASGADGRFLNELRDYREQADYDHGPIEANVDERSNGRRSSLPTWNRWCK